MLWRALMEEDGFLRRFCVEFVHMVDICGVLGLAVPFLDRPVWSNEHHPTQLPKVTVPNRQ